MPTQKSLEVAEILLNGKTHLNTAWGKKTQVGIAALLDSKLFGHEDNDLTEDQQAICPNCSKRGGIIARKDAFVNLSVPASGNIDWDDCSDVSVYDDTVYECSLCNNELEVSAIESVNGFEIK